LNPCSEESLEEIGLSNETCASEEDIKDVLAGSTLSILIIDQYFNDTDFNTGIDGPIWKKPKMF
jgi:hypothetical protein